MHNSGNKFAWHKCTKCGSQPAVSIEADCHGDELTLCEAHWKEWFEHTLLPELHKNKEEAVADMNYTFEIVEE